MHPVLFEIGSLTFYTHGVFAVLGIVLGSFVIYKLAKEKKYKTEYLFDNLVFAVLWGIIGARLSYFIVYPQYLDNWTEVFFVWQGGLISYGGFILGLCAFIVLLSRQKESIGKWLDIGSVGFFVAVFIGRIGDIFAGEYAGKMTPSKWLSIFPDNNLIAVPFFEALLCLLIVGLLAIAYRKFYDKLKYTRMFLASFFLYGLGRFFIDFGREEKDIIVGLSLGQIVSLFLAFITLVLLILSRKERNQNETI